MNQRTFEEIITCIANNNKDALDEFYHSYGKIIFAVAFSVCKSQSDADEVVDEVLVKVWNHAHKIQGIEKPEAWLYRVTFNFAINKIKSRREYETLVDKPLEEEGFIKVIDKLTFYDIIAELSEKEQLILCLKFIGDKTFAEIASIIEKPADSIAYEYYSALKKLKKHIGKFL